MTGFVWREWPDRSTYVVIKTGELTEYGREIQMSPPLAVAILMSPYWANHGVCHMTPELASFTERRNAVLRNPTLESATRLWLEQGLNPPVTPETPLATAHKARLQWLDATDEMLAESIAWLEVHGYRACTLGTPPLTPASRDAQRVRHGKEPLR